MATQSLTIETEQQQQTGRGKMPLLLLPTKMSGRGNLWIAGTQREQQLDLGSGRRVELSLPILQRARWMVSRSTHGATRIGPRSRFKHQMLK
jgi:hypothetical protein